MTAARCVLGVFVMVTCFTTGLGLSCHECEGIYHSVDACDLGSKSGTVTCDPQKLWPEATLELIKTFKSEVPDLPSKEETVTAKNVACMKVLYRSRGKTVIDRGCVFKKFGPWDGCTMNLVEDSVPLPGTGSGEAHILNLEKNRLRQLRVVKNCYLCDTDNCNATIGLTPAFLIYPPFLLLFSIIWKLFLQ